MSTGIVRRRRVVLNPNACRETAAEHIRNALAVLNGLLDADELSDEDRQDVQAAVRRLWRALRELECDEE
jgi:hypothetical protein